MIIEARDAMPHTGKPQCHTPDGPTNSRALVAAIVRCRGSARRALIAYVIAGILLLGQQPYRRMSTWPDADSPELPDQAVQLSLALDAVMIVFLLVGGLSAAVALLRYADLTSALTPRCCQPNTAWITVLRVAAAVLAVIVLSAGVMDVIEDIQLTVEGAGALSTGLTIWVQVLGAAAAVLALVASLVAWSAQAKAAQSLPIEVPDARPMRAGEPLPREAVKSWREKMFGFLRRRVPIAWLKKPRVCHCDGVAEPSTNRELDDRRRRPETAIACSGGGMRSASFTLGALQVFQDAGQLKRSTPVYAVSGGSYMASSFASLWVSNTPPDPDHRDDKVFVERSAEEHRLRNNTRYLAPSGKQVLWGAITLLWGIAVNLALAAMLLRLLAIVVAGWLRKYDVFESLSMAEPSADLPGWRTLDDWLFHLLWVLPLGVATASILLYFGADLVSRPYPWRQRLRTSARVGLLAGVSGLLLLVVVPHTTTALARLAHENNPTVTVASIIDGFGFPTSDGCEAALTESFEAAVIETVRASDAAGRPFGACGATGTAHVSDLPFVRSPPQLEVLVPDEAARPTPVRLEFEDLIDRVEGGYFDQSGFSVQLATLIALVTAVGAMAKGAAGKSTPKEGASAPERKKLGVFRRRLSVAFRDKIRHRLLPWLATVLVLLIAFVALLRWTRDLAIARPEVSVNQIQVWIPVAVLALVCLITNANRSTMHTFYREQVASAFAVRFDGKAVKPRPYKELWTLTSLDKAGINLNICAAASCSEPGVVPPGRECTSFVFSRDHIGMTDDRLPAGRAARDARTKDYESFSPRAVTVPAAVAISGAAISPITGRNATSKPFRLLLAMANIRLGVWLRNPALVNRDPNVLTRTLRRLSSSPGIWWVFREAAGRTQIDDRWLYVTDGGHYENLALVEALRSRPQRLFVLDASGDKEDEFATLGAAVATARMDLGVEIAIVPDPMKIDVDGYAKTSVVLATASWPADQPATDIIYGRLITTDLLPWDAKAYAIEHPEFPLRSTGQQLYGEFDFEAYRVLGREVGRRMMSCVPKT